MEGIEFHPRRPVNDSERDNVFESNLTYPLQMDKKLAQGDAFRRSKDTLSARLNHIEQESMSQDGRHIGSAHCVRCRVKSSNTAYAFAEYFLSLEPGTWSIDFPDLRQLMRTKLDDPKMQLAEVYLLFQTGMRGHFKKDLCTPRKHESETNKSLRRLTISMFDDDTPLSIILQFYLSELDARAKNPETAKLLKLLQTTRTAEERANIYIQLYCLQEPKDSPVQRNFKQKYSRMFEALTPHDEVVTAMHREADDYSKGKIEKARSRMSELKMAQNAHLKNKQRKLDRRRRGEESAREQVVECVLEGCANEVNLVTSEVIECTVCEWLAKKGGQDSERRERAVYCSTEHAQADFEPHDQQVHSCVMGDRCLYYPATGPSTSLTSGICNNCYTHGYISYFCSSDCHNHNYELHRDDFMQRDIGVHNDDDALLVFEPAAEMEMVEFEESGEGDWDRDGDGGVEMERTREREETWDDGELEEGERTDS